MYYFREQFDQEQENGRQQELENLREEEETPTEDTNTKPEPLPLMEDVEQELVSLNVTPYSHWV